VIGFIGHFSAGKSSLINSLLGTWSSQDERRTGLHPTDTVITLLTHQSNADALLGISGGGSVPIRIQTLDNDFLRHIVLADSPGTGDPHLIEEMARDFLPICDLVIFVFSATSPIDETDLPTLRELHKRLPFIPLLFVVTRSDELRRDKHAPLSEGNFNHPKAAEFLAETLSRISRLLDSTQYSHKDFILVDNNAQFGISLLKTELLRRSDPHSPSSRVTVHGHKVRFYLTTAKELNAFFEYFLADKLSELKKIISAADNNIVLYHRSVSVSNNNLTKSWHERYLALQDVRQRAGTQPSALPSLTTTVAEMESVALIGKHNSDAFTRYSTNSAQNIQDHVKLSGFRQIKDEFSKVLRSLQQRNNFDGLTIHGHGLGIPDIQWSLSAADIVDARGMAGRVNDLREATYSCVQDTVSSARMFALQLSEAVNQRTMVERSDAIVTSAQESLNADLDKYFQSVHVYRSGIFSIGTKGSISRLGIGDELARLETEFTDEDKESLSVKAIEGLFPSVAAILASVTTKLRSLADRLRLVEAQLSNVVLDAAPRVNERISELAASKSDSVVLELEAELQHEAAQLADQTQTKLAVVFGNTIGNYDKAIRAAEKQRMSTYAMTAGICMLIGFALTFGYAYLKKTAGQSIGEVIFWGVVAGLIVNAIGLGLAKFRDNYPETKRKVIEQHLAELVSQADSVVNNQLINHKFACLEEKALATRTRNIYDAIGSAATGDAWQQQADKQFEAVHGVYRELNRLRGEYLSVMDELIQEFGRFFNDTEKNLSILQKISDEVKDRAIRPSFELLANTSNQLGELRQEIQTIEFA
jgi:predicted GTPase